MATKLVVGAHCSLTDLQSAVDDVDLPTEHCILLGEMCLDVLGIFLFGTPLGSASGVLFSHKETIRMEWKRQ